jgi:hypothetical protein
VPAPPTSRTIFSPESGLVVGVAAMSCGGQGSGGWLLDYGIMEEEIQGSEFIYMVDDPAVSRSAFPAVIHGSAAASFLMIDWLVS